MKDLLVFPSLAVVLFLFYFQYGGNPVSCAIANAVFDTIVKDNLREKALVVGEYLLDCCQLLAKKHKVIGDVRGAGLFVGIELVKDREQRTPATEAAKYVVSRMKEEHILLSADGPDVNVIKLKPPMVFTKENVDEFVSTFDRVLKELRESEELNNLPAYSANRTDLHATKKTRTHTQKEEQLIKSI